ncbi:MAG: DNA primase, partial [Paracoccaceae bacterium]
GKGLRFVMMPAGQDPDDLLRTKGPAAVQALIDAAQPMVHLLWQRETDGRSFDSPERKAALDKVLMTLTAQIQDPMLRRAYEQALKDLKWDLFRSLRTPAKSGYTPGQARRGSGKGKGRGGWQGDAAGPSAAAKASFLVAQGDTGRIHLREGVILAAVVTCPEILPEVEAGLERLRCADPAHADVRDALLRAAGQPIDDLYAHLCGEIGVGPLETLLRASHLSVMPFMRHSGQADLARLTVTEELAKLDAEEGLTAEIAEAEEDLSAAEDERLTHRITEAANTRNRAVRPSQGKAIDLVRASNGLDIDPTERQGLDAAIRATGVRLDGKPGK